MKHKIDPLVDCVFKALLGSTHNNNLLIHFLNAALNLSGERRIATVTVENPFLEKQFETAKLGVVDIKAKDQREHIYQIEIQRRNHPGIKGRMRFTWSALALGQFKQGSAYKELRPTISIWLLGKSIFSKLPQLHHELRLCDPKTSAYIDRESTIHVFELEKIDGALEVHTELERWLRFLREGKNLDPDTLPPYMQTQEMRQAMETLVGFSEKENLYHLYQARMDAESLENDYLETIKEQTKRADAAEQRAEAEALRAEVAEREIAALRRQLAGLRDDSV